MRKGKRKPKTGQGNSQKTTNLVVYIMLIATSCAVLSYIMEADPDAARSAACLVPLAILFAYFLFTGSFSAMWHVSRLRPYATLLDAAIEGQSKEVLAEAQQRLANGDRSVFNLTLLAQTHVSQRNYPQAEMFAREAITILQAQKTCAKTNGPAIWACTNAYSAMYFAQMNQGRYADAATMLQAHLPQATYRNLFTALTAWAFYLAGQLETARTVLGQIMPPASAPTGGRYVAYVDSPSQPVDPRTHIVPLYMLLVAYMRYKLLRAEITIARDLYAITRDEWHDTTRKTAGTLYGRDLHAMLTELDGLFNINDPVSGAQDIQG